MIGRADFLTGLLVATGGLDVWSSPSPAPSSPAASVTIRVSLADGTIATLDLETYLAGVVPIEMSPSWPAAALEAQAIIARTYALQKRTLSRPYDVLATDADQRYGGPGVEHPSSTAAVTATRGRTLAYAGGPASVFYSSCCGGHTADASEMWGRAGLPYLRGVDDPACNASPDYRWTRTLPLDRARSLLGDRIAGPIAGVDLADPDGSGRPRAAIFRTENGNVTVPVAEIRRRWGATTVRSLWLTRIAIDSTQAVPLVAIEGCGRGHGVGLCQWGTRGLALAGADSAAILVHYFPGTAVIGG
jgi:stage II sporulation protein D